jgi:predicted ATP-grasp superfamily ATP-dependent carboligase
MGSAISNLKTDIPHTEKVRKFKLKKILYSEETILSKA